MKIESPEGQSIDFWEHPILPKKPKHIGLQLSGGIDSAALIVLMFDQFRDSKIHCFTMNGMESIEYTPYAEGVLNFTSKMFPEVKYTWDQYYGTTREECLEQIAEQGWYKENKIEVMVTGTVSVPPPSVFEKWRSKRQDSENYLKLAHDRFEPESNWTPEIDTADHTDVLLYRPFRKVNKFFSKYILDRYNATGILKHTRTCGRLFQQGRGEFWNGENPMLTEQFSTVVDPKTGFEKRVRDPSKPCKHCYWCFERKWAFGTWDGLPDYTDVTYNDIQL